MLGGVLAIAKKECRVQLRYRVVWINMALTPVFMLAPWVLSAGMMSRELGEIVLVGSLTWYWLNQYFFGSQEAFEEEREEGTLVSIALSPMSLMEFLIGKGLWIFVECAYITAVTMLIFRLLGFERATSFEMLLLYLASGAYMFAFSILWGALALRFRRIGGINFAVQETLGLVSGVTASVSAYPRVVRLVAYVVPLTYTIEIGRKVLTGATFREIAPAVLALTAVTALYLLLGWLTLRKAEEELRRNGEWEAW